MLKKIETGLQDCYIIKPSVFGDDRGYFSPFFIQKDMEDNNLFFDGVVQCNRSKSAKGVVRGLHFQKDPKCQTKLVEVINGAAIDVVVDIREGSLREKEYYAFYPLCVVRYPGALPNINRLSIDKGMLLKEILLIAGDQ